MNYFKPLFIHTKEQHEEADLSRLFIWNTSFSVAKEIRLFNAFVFHQWRGLFSIRFSIYDTEVRLFFDIFRIEINYSLR